MFGNSKIGEELGSPGNFNKARAQRLLPMLLYHSGSLAQITLPSSAME